jgi:1-acyl-sn-glycerol-3-phosphate acyltransferase
MPMGRLHRFQASWIGDMDLVPHLGKLIQEGAIDVEVHFAEPIAFTHASDRKKVTREIEATIRATMARVLRDPRASDGIRRSAS